MQTSRAQKVTVHIPQHLLQAAIAVTQKNITDTIKFSLEEIARKQAYDNLRKSRGKIKFSINVNKMRDDE